MGGVCVEGSHESWLILWSGWPGPGWGATGPQSGGGSNASGNDSTKGGARLRSTHCQYRYIRVADQF